VPRSSPRRPWKRTRRKPNSAWQRRNWACQSARRASGAWQLPTVCSQTWGSGVDGAVRRHVKRALYGAGPPPAPRPWLRQAAHPPWDRTALASFSFMHASDARRCHSRPAASSFVASGMASQARRPRGRRWRDARHGPNQSRRSVPGMLKERQRFAMKALRTSCADRRGRECCVLRSDRPTGASRSALRAEDRHTGAAGAQHFPHPPQPGIRGRRDSQVSRRGTEEPQRGRQGPDATRAPRGRPAAGLFSFLFLSGREVSPEPNLLLSEHLT